MASSSSSSSSIDLSKKVVLVIDSTKKDWQSIFNDVCCPKKTGKEKLNKKTKKNKSKGKSSKHKKKADTKKEEGGDIKGPIVHVAPWEDIRVVAQSGAKPLVATRGGQMVQPDVVLVRQLVDRLAGQCYRNVLMALMVSGIPSVNSFMSVFMCLERPVVIQQLWSLRVTEGEDRFPMVRTELFSHSSLMKIPSTQFPLVAKVGNAEAGHGKLLFKEQGPFNDFIGLIALHEDFVTLERLIEKRECDLRIQKIGPHIRAFKRVSMSGNWKTNVGQSQVEVIDPVPEEYCVWARLAGSLFGGMDILTVDAIRTTDGRCHIIEINDCASGLHPDFAATDQRHIAELVKEKLESE